MPNLKTLKERIRSVKSTKKITSAMKMVATANFKRFQGQLFSVRRYASRMNDVFAQGYHQLLLTDSLPFFMQENASFSAPHAIVVFSSERGLCSHFNTQVVARALQIQESLKTQGKDCIFYVVGSKGFTLLERALKNSCPQHLVSISYKNLTKDIVDLRDLLIQQFQAKALSGCTVVYTSFQSAINTTPASTLLFPVLPPTLPEKLVFGVEPAPEAFVAEIGLFKIFSDLMLAAYESKASEESTRMMAMENATKNAKDMIEKLEIIYNRNRQSNITKELIEIISGAEAL